MTLRILANHAHVFPQSVNAEGTIERLLRLMDACEIEQAVCFAPFSNQLRGADVQQNPWLAAAISGNPRLFGFGTLDLTRSDVKDQVAQIRDLGLRGIKMHPNVQEFDIVCPAAMQAYAAAQDLRLFITFHSGVHHYRIAHYEVLKFDEVAYQFPDLRFSLEHVGGYAFFNEALAVITNNIPFPPIPGRLPRVYGGLTSIFTPDFIRMWYMPPQRLLELIAQSGAERLIFGLDFPYNLEDHTRTALHTLRSLGLTEEKLRLILGENLRQLIE
jgi:predicted TIM-barrel fold metal-dependent hydrolase